MYSINKIIGYLISPVGFGMTLVAAAVLARVLSRRRLAGGAVLLALANFWVWSTPWMTQRMGVALEAEFLIDGRVPEVESFPQADAIVLHGGAMGVATNISPYAEMWTSADRVWHAARIWKVGKAPVIFVTGGGVKLTTAGLLQDLGIPTNAVVFVEDPRNTEEEAKAVSSFRFQVPSSRFQDLGEKLETCNMKLETTRPKVLVVTSAWHLKRTMLMYQKYAPNVEAIPAPCDFENTMVTERVTGWTLFLPDPAAFMANSVAFHEWLGYWGYKILR